MKRKYAPKQLAYMEALAAYQVNEEETTRKLQPIMEKYALNRGNESATDQLVDLEMDLREACGWNAAHFNLVEARVNLVKWAHERAKREPGYPMLAEEVFEKAKYHPTIYAKLVDLCLRWAA